MKNSSLMAFDRVSVRSFDGYGHLRVATSPISKANVCPYFGREIPGHKSLGLHPDKIYKLYRDPAELEAGASSFAGKPILLRHIPVAADEHPRELVVGAIGDDVTFSVPYLKAPLTIWDKEAIDLIQSDEQREISCGYAYVPDMTPGSTPEGERYDGRMTNIKANHLALVTEGRAGPDVVVSDAALNPKPTEKPDMAKKPIALTRQALLVEGALAAHIRPKLAQDAKLDLRPVLSRVTAKNLASQRKSILDDVKTAVTGKLAQDAEIDTNDLEKILEVVEALGPEEEAAPATDDDLPAAGETAVDSDGLSEEEEAQYQALAKRRKPAASDEEPDDDKDKVSKPAMDAAIASAVKAAEARVRTTLRDIATAEDDVRPYVGKLAVTFDSASDVYQSALEAMGVDIKGVHPSAFRAILKSQPKPNTKASNPAVAMDAAAKKSFEERFPNANRLK